MRQRRPPSRSRWCGLILSLVCLEAVVVSAYVTRNSPQFSLLRLGIAIEDRDETRAARWLDPLVSSSAPPIAVRDGVTHGYSLQIGPWRAFPHARALGSLEAWRDSAFLELRGSCGGKPVSVDVHLGRVDAGRADLAVFKLPLYDWRVVGISPASLCDVVHECLRTNAKQRALEKLRCPPWPASQIDTPRPIPPGTGSVF
ncbi:MAG: hypothetical protein Q8O67_24295 [Deltaproteobacteria bacterium]|nr:hypothetical protein [Deltaproteobacteria bacterium]